MNNSMVSPSIVIEAIGDFASQRDSVEIPSDPVMSDSFECTIVPPAAAGNRPGRSICRVVLFLS